MNREKLIAYSFYFAGEYDRIINAIEHNIEIPTVKIANALTIFDRDYPVRLLDLKYPPLVLYYKGDLSLLKRKAIAIVGSRQPCSYAVKATAALARAQSDKVIISGLAKGIDACAHENASDTIGILGCGIDYIYPRCNYELIRKIEREGLVISEYPTLSKPLASHFPFRNRLIAALADKVYIMQSAIRSGTMTTVNEALELGKEIAVLPYELFDENGRQNNTLIYEGAQPISCNEIAF